MAKVGARNSIPYFEIAKKETLLSNTGQTVICGSNISEKLRYPSIDFPKYPNLN